MVQVVELIFMRVRRECPTFIVLYFNLELN